MFRKLLLAAVLGLTALTTVNVATANDYRPQAAHHNSVILLLEALRIRFIPRGVLVERGDQFCARARGAYSVFQHDLARLLLAASPRWRRRGERPLTERPAWPDARVCSARP